MLLLEKFLPRRAQKEELEIQTQKESFEKEVHKLQSEQHVKLAEKQSLLEQEKQSAREEAEKLRVENENLQKLLQEEREMKSILEKEQEAILEKSLRDENDSNTKLTEHQKEIERLKQELKEEKRRSLLLEEQEKSKIESLLEAERQHLAEVQLKERQRFESELEKERKRIGEQRRQAEKDFRDVCCQSPSDDISMGLPPVVPDNESTSTETFYNVLLAEIMSLQLLYQMQDIADVCSGVAPRSTDSGWADYDDELLENMGINLLEKGGLILDSLRAVQSGDIISIASVDSIRDALLFQFPSSPKISCSTDERNHQRESKVSRDLLTEFERKEKPLCNSSSSTMASKVSSDFWVDNNNAGSGTSSSMGSYCDQEPLSPRNTRQTSDSGCEMSPVDPRLNLQKEKVGSSVCVPLAEEDDEDLVHDDSMHQMQILKDKVSTLDMELARLKSELDKETVNFFSAVFLVDLSAYTEDDSPRVMRYLFDCVRDKLCTEITARGIHKEPFDQKELELPLSVLEQAVNLLLVNKTVMSCILVLQSRAKNNQELGMESISEMSTTLVREDATKFDQETQTDDHSKSIKHHLRKGLRNFTSRHKQSAEDTGTCTDPKSPMYHRECQTSDDWSRSPLLFNDENDGKLSRTDSQEDPWSKSFEEIMSGNTLYSDDLHGDMSRDLPCDRPSRDLLSRDIARVPDGASEGNDSRSASPNTPEAAESGKNEEDKVLIDSEDEDIEDQSKRKKKRINLLSCLGSKARVSFRKKANNKKAEGRTVKTSKDN